MTEPLDRKAVLGLLQKLGSERDSEVLEAARQVHAQVTGAGLSWEELLVADAAESVAEAPEELSEPIEEAVDLAAEAGANAAALALIEKLLAKPDISAELRQELEDYKTDIASDEFLESDRRYVRALYERMTGR